MEFLKTHTGNKVKALWKNDEFAEAAEESDDNEDSKSDEDIDEDEDIAENENEEKEEKGDGEEKIASKAKSVCHSDDPRIYYRLYYHQQSFCIKICSWKW